MIFLFLFLIAKETDLLPSFDFTGNLNYLTIFAIGLVASTSTCMATSGALYLSLINKSQITNSNLSKAVLFNAGRIISYGFFGLLAGFVGQALITNSGFGPFLTLLAAIFMILLGLDMAKIISIGKIIPSSLNKSIFLRLEDKIKMYPNKAPFFLGAITYLLPCGFTQAVQVYALGQGSPIQSAITMIVFALGTVPALLLIGSMSSLTANKFYPYFLKVMGVLVFVVGFIYFSNFTSLYGININPFSKDTPGVSNSATIKNGTQTIEMRVVTSGYLPNYFTVKKDVPVKWVINGENVFGCQAYLVVPKLGIQKTIVAGEQTIDFTPTETGFINFSCGMGMYRGRIEVIN
ncbi:MAG: Heavy metal transport/detoxification protein [Candidatus Roizmanbacteria bacterium GW2011_GWA2_35_8]|uniref:Heavy metal transport/detoxification protein n=1 Tax=Candidatus Roizmanbacteria bacterium GW2011_GWA2_35_8 TaxID=1618479 RepID=A0A0G0G1H8_9BACT|nr:MAG: Heavy metal transport/detoxification protein [Candidatus Roizmanbacteria bacterium GW2011_GWA2_35_8]